MPWLESLETSPMQRVAVVAPDDRLRDVLVAAADVGVVEFDLVGEASRGGAADAAQRASQHLSSAPGPAADLTNSPVLAREVPDLHALERDDRVALLAGEAEAERVTSHAIHRASVAALAGWTPTMAVPRLTEQLARFGGAVVRLPPPPGKTPPTMLQGGRASRAFQPLVNTYGVVPYRDVNPSVFAGLAYVAMFGMMFGDVGHGLLLVTLGILIRAGWPRRLSSFDRLAPFVVGAGLASAAFGLAYGEAFGPTKLVPALWMRPLDHPTTLLAVAVAVGAVLLALAYALGTVNRWREAGAGAAAMAIAGGAGATVYLGLAAAGLGWYLKSLNLAIAGAAVCVAGLALGYRGSLAAAGGRGRGLQAAIEVFDSVVRIGSNTVSFTRLAAFGLTHAALGDVVWKGTTALWGRGTGLWLPAGVLFVVGNAAAFSLEGLVAGVQALRLEYNELFSRIFVTEGHAFHPWHVPTFEQEEETCSPG